MQQATAIHAEAGERGVEGAEVVFGGLVGADVLGGDDGGEVAAQPLVAAGEAGPVHVGEDDQLVVLGQPGQCVGGVRIVSPGQRACRGSAAGRSPRSASTRCGWLPAI